MFNIEEFNGEEFMTEVNEVFDHLRELQDGDSDSMDRHCKNMIMLLQMLKKAKEKDDQITQCAICNAMTIVVMAMTAATGYSVLDDNPDVDNRTNDIIDGFMNMGNPLI